jgi:hypothetical protein
MSLEIFLYLLIIPALLIGWSGIKFAGGRLASLDRIAHAYLFSELKKYHIQRNEIPADLADFICSDCIWYAQRKIFLQDEKVQRGEKAFNGNSIAVRVQLAELIQIWAVMIAGHIHSEDLDRPKLSYHDAFEKFKLKRRPQNTPRSEGDII